MKCLRCNGRGILTGIFPIYGEDIPLEKRKPFVQIKCDVCEGTGEIDSETEKRIEMGKKIREERLAKNLSLREYAELNGIDAVTQSKIERGCKIKSSITLNCNSEGIKIQ